MSLANIRKALNRHEILVPKLKQFLIQERLDLESGKKSKKDVVVHDSQLSIDCFKERIEEFNHDVTDDLDQLLFHPSAIGQCLRKLWFQVNRNATTDEGGSEDVLKTYVIFELGTYVHVLFQNLCERAGFLKAREVPIVDKRLKIIGHADGILELDGEKVLLEIKTINSRGFTLLGQAPDLSHKKQAMTYMKALGLPKAAIVYINKDRNEVREYCVEFDDEFWKKQCQPRITKFLSCVAKNEIPDREGTQKDAMPCRFCAYAGTCFDSRKLGVFHAVNKTVNPDKESLLHLRNHAKKIKEQVGSVKKTKSRLARRPKKVRAAKF